MHGKQAATRKGTMSQFQMTFRGLVPSDALREVAEEKFQRTVRKFGALSTCHIIVAREATRKPFGSPYAVRVLLHAGHVYATAEASDDNPCAAVRTAFARAQGQADDARRHLRMH
jgi:ribosome-associated translation inhibitor RaiA